MIDLIKDIAPATSDFVETNNDVSMNIINAMRGKVTQEKFMDICNKSIGETFTRSIYTSITTLIPVVALIVLGSREIFTFNTAMLIGLITGTYSSLLIAPALFMDIEKHSLGKPQKKKKVYRDDVEEKMVKGVNC